jgi:sugar lactone lactonase YvrE
MPGVAPIETNANPAAGATLQGTVHGGQNPIVGASVYLYAANVTGYGNASVSLLTNPVATNANGGFTITGDYTCPSTASQVYLYAVGGNAGSGANSAAGLLAALGTCPASGTLSSTLFIGINEVSTVATAYAIAGYATDATHVSSSGTALAKSGIANAFANVPNMETLSTGVALATTPAGNGTVPQSEINTLANILAACINSSGPTSTPCATLLGNATNGSTTPTDTATAAINIAHNPAANVATLYGLQTGSAPFQPALSAQPSDFTVALSFTGGGIDAPFSLAVDGDGNIWMANDNSTVSKMNGVTGAAISPAGGYTGNGLTNPFSIAIDPSGNAWVANMYLSTPPSTVSEFTSSGGVATGSPFSGGGLSNENSFNAVSPRDIAFDASGNVWIANLSGTVTELNGTTGAAISGSPFSVSTSTVSPSGVAVDSEGHLWVSGYNADTLYEMAVSNGAVLGSSAAGAGAMQQPYSIAVDASNDVWLPNQYDANSLVGYTVSKFTSVTSGTAYSGGGILGPDGVAIDGGGNVWISNEIHVNPATTAGLTEMNNSGAAVSPATGYLSSSLFSAADVGVDGSGNVWVANAVEAGTFANGTNVVEFVGAATPVVTPLSVAVKNSTIGARP